MDVLVLHDSDNDDDLPRSLRKRQATSAIVAQVIGGGGFACTLLVHGIHEGPTAVRITQRDRGVDEAREHIYLQTLLRWGMPRILSYEQALPSALDPAYAVAMEGDVYCRANLGLWRKNGDKWLTITHMEYADGGTLHAFDNNASLNAAAWFRRHIFLLIGLLGVAQHRVGFQHGDLTGTNIVLRTTEYEGRAVQVPQLIDLDFATYGQYNDVNRLRGSFHVMPLEFTTAYASVESRQVPGAYDIWSLGMIIYSKAISRTASAFACHPHVFAILAQRYPLMVLDFETDTPLISHLLVVCAHAKLMDNEPKTYGKYAYETRLSPVEQRLLLLECEAQIDRAYGAAIAALTANTRELLERMLNLDPMERMFRGDLNRYFAMSYFQKQDRNALIRDYLLPLMAPASGARQLPSQFSNVRAHIRQISAAQLPLVCAQCGAKEAAYLHEERGVLLCAREECARNQIPGSPYC